MEKISHESYVYVYQSVGDRSRYARLCLEIVGKNNSAYKRVAADRWYLIQKMNVSLNRKEKIYEFSESLKRQLDAQYYCAIYWFSQ